MKAALVTFPLYVNYGGILQCWALQNVISKYGYEVEVIHLPSPKVSLLNVVQNSFRKLQSYINNERRQVPIKLTEFLQYNIAFAKTRKFISKNINFTSKTYTLDNLVEINKAGYDVYVVGSDQIWRSYYAIRWLELYFLTFVEKQSRRIAYAPSFGVDYPEYNQYEKARYGQYYSMFDYVSVREESGLSLIEEYSWTSQRPCQHVLDPTMLLTSSKYIDLLSLKRRENKTVFVYLLSKNTLRPIINEVSALLGCEVITSILLDDTFTSIFKRRLSPIEWLENIYNSEFVITDSFHGCVFSIIFNKNFIIFGDNIRGNARLSSLLCMFNLSSRMVISEADFFNRKNELMLPIDYVEVNNILDQKRKESCDFLQEALSL